MGGDTFRALEELEIAEDRIGDALADLDNLLRDWADRYHDDDGVPMVLQMGVGHRDEDNA
ncbi:MAG: hypothetical protein AAF788_05675 [Pseudomonadota bacterium]